MTTTDLAAALLRDVPRYEQTGRGMNPDQNGAYFAVDDVLAALTAALPARGVGVRQLEWFDITDEDCNFEAYATGFRYWVRILGTARFAVFRNAWDLGDHPDAEAAKAAAQADYEARILAALAPTALIATRPLTDEEAAAIRAEGPGRCYPAPTDAAQAQSPCPYGATGDDCCGGYCDMDDDQKGGYAFAGHGVQAPDATSPGVTAGADAAQAREAAREENRWAYIQAALDDNQSEAQATVASLKEQVEAMRGEVEWQEKRRRDAFGRRHITAPEDPHVYVLCKRYGFGAVMDAASRLWAREDSMGAFYIGGCIGIKPAALTTEADNDRA